MICASRRGFRKSDFCSTTGVASLRSLSDDEPVTAPAESEVVVVVVVVVAVAAVVVVVAVPITAPVASL